MKKKHLPHLLLAVGIGMGIMSQIIRHGGLPDADVAITNLTSSFMLIGGCICAVVGIVTYFIKDDNEDW